MKPEKQTTANCEAQEPRANELHTNTKREAQMMANCELQSTNEKHECTEVQNLQCLE